MHLATFGKSAGLNLEDSIWGKPNCLKTLSLSFLSASSSLTETPSSSFEAPGAGVRPDVKDAVARLVHEREMASRRHHLKQLFGM